mgnify:FL=1
MNVVKPFCQSVLIPLKWSLIDVDSEFVFPVDCVLHGVASNANFSCAAGSAGAVIGGFNIVLSELDFSNNTTPVGAVHYYRYRPGGGAAGNGFFSTDTKFDSVFIHAGTKFVAKAHAILGVPAIDASFTLFYNTLAEWQSFREPNTVNPNFR